MKYPKNLNTVNELNDYGEVRIYAVTKEEANEIAKEFPGHFQYKPAFNPDFENRQLFYMNVSHGKQHFIFSLPQPLPQRKK